MKKITFFLLSLLCALGSMAQDGPTITAVTRATEITEGKWYIMEQWRGGASYLFENDSHQLYRKQANQTADQLVNQSVNENKSALVRFIKDDGAETYKIQLATGYYFQTPTHNSAMTATNQPSLIGHFYKHNATRTDDGIAFQFGTTATGGVMIDTKDVSGGSNTVDGWNSTFKDNVSGSDNNAWKIFEVTLSTDVAQVNVNLKEEGNTETSGYDYSLGTWPVGMTLSPLSNYMPAPESGLLNIATKEETVAAGTNNFELTYTAKVPFADSYQALTDNEKWTSIYTGNARMYVYKDGVTDGYPAIDNATFMGLTDNCFWGFICKDPFTGPIYIVNKAAGPNMYLQMSTVSKTDNADKPCVMVNVANEEALATTERVGWVFKQATSHPSNQYSEDFSHFFGIKNLGTGQYINNFRGNGYMTSWTDDASQDRGSGCKFTPERETYITLGQRALTAPEGAVHSLKSECRAEIGTSEDIESKPLNQLREIVRNHNENNHGTIQMEDNGYYRLLNWQDHDNNAKVISFSGDNRALETLNNSEVNQLWKAVPQGTAGNQFQFVNANAEKYLNNPQTAALNASAITYTLTDLGAGQHFFITNGAVLKGTLSDGNLTDMGSEGTGGTYRKNTADTWYIMPVKNFEIALHDGNDNQFYATAHFPFAITLSDAEAYVMDGYAENVVNLTKVEGEIPANTGLVIVGTTNKATVNILSETSATASNQLAGTNTDKDFDETNFIKDKVLVLGMGATSRKVGFYHAADATTKVRHNSAYIDTTDLTGVNTVNGFMFNFGGDTTGLQTVTNGENTHSVIYDLQGRRVTAPAKGVYIINGKKVIR